MPLEDTTTSDDTIGTVDEFRALRGDSHAMIYEKSVEAIDDLASMEVRGHVPGIAMLVNVEEAFIHCGKAPKRGRLWDPAAQIDRSIYPRMGEVMFDHGKRYEKHNIDRERMTQMAQDDYDNYVYPTDLD